MAKPPGTIPVPEDDDRKRIWTYCGLVMDATPDLAFLQRLSLIAAQTLDADALVQLVIDQTTGALGVDVCSVYLLEDDGETLLLTATNGLSQAGVGHVRLRVGEGITGWAAKDRAPKVVRDVREERRFRWMHGVDQARFVSMCSIPIMSADRLVGVLNVQTDERRIFSVDEVDFLVAIAAQVAGVLERSAMHDRLQRHVELMQRSSQIHARFTALSLEGAGLTTICEAIAEQARAAVALYDEDGRCRIRAAADADAFPDRRHDLPEPSDRLLLHPVRAGTTVLGLLAVIPNQQSDAVSERAVEHGVTVVALELERERATLEVESRLHGDVVEELLAGRLSEIDVRRLTERASRLGLQLRRRMWVMVVSAEGPTARSALGDPIQARRLIGAVAQTVRGRHHGATIVERGGAIVALIPHPAAVDHVERTGQLVLGALQQHIADTFRIGISGEAGEPGDLSRLFEQATVAVRVGRRIDDAGHVASYRRFGAERILMVAADHTNLAAFVDEWLGDMIRHEQQGRAAAPLIETIETLTEVSWSLRAAARRLDIHVNTLLYRLQRARVVSGRDLDSPDVRLSLALALRARRMLEVTAPAAHPVAHAGFGAAVNG